MRYLLFIYLMFFSKTIWGQDKIGDVQVGAMLHDFNQPGVSVVYNFNIGKVVGLGAGADIIGYEKKALIPLYTNLKVKIPLEKVQPYLDGQFGYTIYNNEATYNGAPEGMSSTVKGGVFYSPGAGVKFQLPKIDIFLQYNHRFYTFDAEHNPQIPDQYQLSIEESPSVGMINIGIVF